MSNTKSKLRRVRTIAQVFAMLAATGAGVVGAVGLPGLQPPDASLPPDTITPGPVDPATGDPTDHAKPAHDSGLIADQFAMLGNAPPPKETTPEIPVETGVIEPGTRDPDAISLRYIGRMVIAGKPRAVLVFDDQQKLLAVGKAFKGVELIKVDPEFVIVMRDDERERIELQGMTLSRVTSSQAPPPEVPSNTGKPTPSNSLKGGKDQSNAKPTPAGETIRRRKSGASSAAAPTSELARRMRERREQIEAQRAENK